LGFDVSAFAFWVWRFGFRRFGFDDLALTVRLDVLPLGFGLDDSVSAVVRDDLASAFRPSRFGFGTWALTIRCRRFGFDDLALAIWPRRFGFRDPVSAICRFRRSDFRFRDPVSTIWIPRCGLDSALTSTISLLCLHVGDSAFCVLVSTIGSRFQRPGFGFSALDLAIWPGPLGFGDLVSTFQFRRFGLGNLASVIWLSFGDLAPPTWFGDLASAAQPSALAIRLRRFAFRFAGRIPLADAPFL
jgi:hypothetical protein